MRVLTEEFRQVKSSTSADERGRVNIGSEAGKKDYAVHTNGKGQFLLTPVVHIPEYEAWLFKNPAALASVQEGLRQSARGEGEVMDFSQYLDLEIED